MKKSILSLMALGLISVACTPTDDILDDFQVHISPTFYKYVVEIDVEDLTDPETPINGTVNVSLSGPDADAIYNIDGTKNFKVNFGTLQLMVSKEAEPTPSNPLDFKVSFEANGYKKTELSFSIAEEDYYIADNARMLNLGNLPSSIGNTSANGSIDPNTNQLAQPLVVNAGSADSLAKIKLTVPTDVKFLDADGNEIVGKRGGTGLNVNILSLSDTSEAAQAAFPNGTGLIQIVQNEDGTIDTLLLDHAGTFDINMDLDGTPVRAFSGGKTTGGVAARIPIDPDATNEEFNRAYQEGDSVSLLSLSEGDNAWVEDDRSYVVKKDPVTSELYFEPTLEHLSYYRRKSRKKFKPVKYYLGVGAYYTPGVSANSGSISGSIRATYEKTSRSGKVRRRHVNLRGNFGPDFRRNRAKRYASYAQDVPVFQPQSGISSSAFNFSTETYTYGKFEYRVLKMVPKNQPVSIGYRLYCGSSNTLVSPPAGVKMYYRKHNSGAPFAHLYTFTNENLSTTYATFPALEKNEFYDFQARFNDVQKDTMNVQVVDGRIYDVIMPDRACNSLGL
ncbi:hypothetical protein [Croceimicrobium sp.]|uniref:hypothetical protein n=1 Tax=Croceimicrobium sp. TaxID=2828340 RepID=UPI003BA97E0D